MVSRTTTFGAASSIDMFANFCQEIMAVLGTRIRKCLDFLGIAQKVRHFQILVPKTAKISWQKLANISMELAAPNVVVIRIGLQSIRKLLYVLS